MQCDSRIDAREPSVGRRHGRTVIAQDDYRDADVDRNVDRIDEDVLMPISVKLIQSVHSGNTVFEGTTGAVCDCDLTSFDTFLTTRRPAALHRRSETKERDRRDKKGCGML